ncbi:penicillin-binding transpeptidase domain-containing protein [Clostridium culturomicium]|uniref:penicillin-binding transpeptidase domain-containing protein n=1 Tax=Clostridium culturomicium TaxID=1499683 RepID=UPI003857CA08
MSNDNNKKDLSRYKVFYIAMGVIFAIISARLIYLQVVMVDEYRDKANNNNYMNVSVPAARGDIIDADGNVFATSVQSYTLDFTETPESKANFYSTMKKVFEILEEKKIPMVDDFAIVINSEGKLEFNFQSTDEQSRRWLELRFKKDRGFDEIIARKEYGDDVKMSELDDEQNAKIEELLLQITAEEAFRQLEKDYGITQYYECTLEEERNLIIIKDNLKMSSYSGYDQITIANSLDQETAFVFQQLQASLPGISVDNKPMRYYPENDLGSAFLGYISAIDPWNEEVYEEQGYNVNTDEVGKTGIEAAFEADLKGTKGQQRIQVNKAGRRVAVLGEVEAYAGDTVKLNIDMDIQKVAEKALDDTLEQIRNQSGKKTENATRGAVVVMKTTGEVLALASRPGFDSNMFTVPGLLTPEISQEYFNPDLEKKGREYIESRGLANLEGILSRDELNSLSYEERVELVLNRMFPLDDRIEGNTTIREDFYDIFPKPFYNYATQSLVPPGSTFKPVTVLAGLEEGVITPYTTIYDNGHYNSRYPDYKGACWIYNKYRGSHGWINAAKALEVSCNYFMYDVADRLYAKTGGDINTLDFLAQYAWKLGLGVPRGSDIKPTTGIEITENFGQVYNYESSKDTLTNAYINQLVEFLEQGINSRDSRVHYKPFDIVKVPEFGSGKELEQKKLTNSKKKALVDALKEEIKRETKAEENEIIERFTGLIQEVIKSDKAIEAIGYTDDDIYYIALAMFHCVNDARTSINSAANAYDASIGQGMNYFTPLQVASYIATLVNGGNRYEVKLVDKVLDSETGEVIKDYTPQIISKAEFNQSNIDAVKAGMRDVTAGENGTTNGVFNGFPIPSGGKTGTSNVVDEKIQDAIGRNAAGLYVGFAPYDNPEIVVCSILFDSDGDRGTIARATFEEYFREAILEMNPGYKFMYDFHTTEETAENKTE